MLSGDRELGALHRTDSTSEQRSQESAARAEEQALTRLGRAGLRTSFALSLSGPAIQVTIVHSTYHPILTHVERSYRRGESAEGGRGIEPRAEIVDRSTLVEGAGPARGVEQVNRSTR